jgi:putative nucleotidyltransferase with HDIG domain
MEMLSPSMMEDIGYSRLSKHVVKLEQGLILPLINDLQQAIGVIYVETINFEDGLRLLEIYCNQAASSINNAFLHSLVNVKNDELNRTYDQLKLRYMDKIEALRQAVDAKDFYTRGHSDRVAYYAMRIGQALGMDPQELETLRISGIFHDIGKIGTADDILLKTDRLDDRDVEEIQKHPLKGARILSAVSMFKDVVPVVRCHHERMDGTGYPDGIKKEEIPRLARIISVADAFDAMMSDRLYRSKLNLEEARHQLINGAGSQFDEEIVNVFVSMIDGAGYGEMLSELAATYE